MFQTKIQPALRWAQDRRQRRTIGGIALVVVAGGSVALFSGAGQTQQVGAAPPPVPVSVVLVEQRDLPHLVDAVGTVESLQNVTVRSQVDGVLTRVLFKEGDLVAKGQLLATIDDRALSAALAAARAQLTRDEAQLRIAQLDLDRYRSLLERNAISRQTVDQQSAQVDQLRATVELDQANVDTARVNLSFTRIVSPVAGRVGIRRVDAGNLVRTSDVNGIVSVAQVNPISIVFPVPQAILGNVKANGQTRQGAVVEAQDRDSAKTLGTGRITAIDNALDPTTGTARVRAQFDNASERLAPGAFVSVRLRTGFTPGAVVVPAQVVRPGVEGSFVYRVRNGAAQRVPVQLGFSNDEVAVIARGLAPGDIIVSDGYSRLADGTKIALTDRAGAAQDARR